MNIEEYAKYKQQYEEKYNNISRIRLFPLEFLQIHDYNLKTKLLKKALSNNISLYQLPEIRLLHEQRLDEEIDNNIRISLEKRRRK